MVVVVVVVVRVVGIGSLEDATVIVISFDNSFVELNSVLGVILSVSVSNANLLDVVVVDVSAVESFFEMIFLCLFRYFDFMRSPSSSDDFIRFALNASLRSFSE